MTTNPGKPQKGLDEELVAMLKYLRLRRLLSHWDDILAAARRGRYSAERLLTSVVEEEYRAKRENARLLRRQRANIPELLEMETFPFARQPKLDRKKIMSYYDSFEYMSKQRNMVWLPGSFPVCCPLGDESRVVRLAAVDHFGNGSGQRHSNQLLVELAIAELLERPFDLDIGVASGTVVPIRFDRYGTNSSSNEYCHERMAGFVVSVDFRHVYTRSRDVQAIFLSSNIPRSSQA